MENGNNNQVSWKVLGVVGVIALGVTLGIVYTEFIQSGSEEISSEEESKQVKIKRKVYSKQESSYTELPKLSNLTYKEYNSYRESLTVHEYGYKAIYEDEIGTKLFFKTPKAWIVENVVDKSYFGEEESPLQSENIWDTLGISQENNICFRLYGEKGIWGTIVAVDLSNVSVKNTRELANYYNKKKIFSKLFEDIKSSDVTKENHIFRGFGFGVTEIEQVFARESYSTVKTPETEYANLTYYNYGYRDDFGIVMEIYIPVKELTLKTRTIALLVGKSYVDMIYDWENLEKLKPVEEKES